MSHFVPSSVPAEGLGVLVVSRLVEQATPAFFAPDRRIQICRAPGRLDVIGGIAAPGSLALHLPTAEAACTAIQRRADDLVRLWSPCRDGSRTERISVSLADLGLPAAPLSYGEARAFLCANPRDAWSAHLLVPLLVLARERGFAPTTGFDLLLFSDVPERCGAGSSAAVEVAAMRAMAQAFGLELSGAEVAELCLQGEREVVGADRGNAAHMVAACSEAGELMTLRGDLMVPEDSIVVPDGLEFVGLDSGVRTGVATAANDPAAGARAERFATLLQQPLTAASHVELGELMLASYTASAAMGQSHPTVQFLGDRARERVAAGAGLFGANTAGRGTVVLIGERVKVWHESLRIKKALLQQTGHTAHVFRYSSPGAMAFGSVELLPVAG